MSEGVTESGLFIPDMARKETDRVTIVKVGNGTPSRPMKLKEGQTGYRVHKWGQPVEYKGELHYIMEDAAIIALD